MTIKFLALLALLSLLAACVWSANGRNDETINSADLILASREFSDGEHTGVVTNSDGLTLDSSSDTGRYTSPVMDAPLAYNALVPQWQADIPEAASMTIRLRTGTDKGWWSEWFGIRTGQPSHCSPYCVQQFQWRLGGRGPGHLVLSCVYSWLG